MRIDEEEVRMEIPEDLQAAADFHGHLCPGLAVGYRACKVAMDRLGVARAYDEELVCVVENNSCSVDAVQVMTGCTFGKGNLFFRDYGKQVFTFASRGDPSRGVRVSLRPDAFSRYDSESDLAAKRKEALARLLDAEEEELFFVDEVKVSLPEEARILPSVLCSNCGEPTMETRTVEVDGRILCIPCSKGWNPPRRR